MKRTMLVAAAAALVVAVLPATAAAQDDTAQVTIVQGSTYSIGADSERTLCIDGEPLQLTEGDIVGPETWDTGTYQLELDFGLVDDCEDPIDTVELELEADDDVTLMIYWGDETDGIAILDNDTSCAEDGEGRLIVRNATFSFEGDPIGLEYTDDGDTIPLLEDVPTGEQDSVDLPAGVYEDVEITGFGENSEGFEQLEITEDEALVVYIAGGADGLAGGFTDTFALDVCPDPVDPPEEEIEEPEEEIEEPEEEIEEPELELEVAPLTATPRFTG